MRTVANIKSHPIHPMLVAFPVAFFYGAFACDTIGTVGGMPRWWETGAYMALAGIASAFLAAIPGLVDYLYSVPLESSGKKRATYHMIVNLSAVGLFAIAWFVRRSATVEPGWTVLLPEATGLALMTFGGWLGGTLVYRNLIGPDHRQAGAGRWKEESIEPGDGFIEVAGAGELEIDQMKLLRVGDKRYVLARTADGYVAFDDHCTHRGGSLADGVLMGGCVQCMWHGSRFDVKTGKVVGGPAAKPIGTYEVERRNGKIWMKT
jgi:uncharacterized membrane protein/nitrite reductase/ring-hydroxylating ferredoxin subunit